MKQSKKICVFTSHVYGNFQNKLCTGIINKAREYGCRVDIFTSNDGENLGDYGCGEQSILSLPHPESYCGAIFASDTYLLPELRDAISSLLMEKFTCPIIDIRQTSSSFPRIALENHKSAGELADHLADVHHYKNICYLGSTAQSSYSSLRHEAFCKSMNSHGLVKADSSPCTYSCGHDEGEIENALHYFLSQEKKPDAIICYNDQMAFSLIAACKKRGLRIPEDIAVTGCDTLEFGQNTSPVLTSATFPIDIIGETAVTQLIHALRGDEIPPVTKVNASIFIGASCGCQELSRPFPFAYSLKLYSQIDNLERIMLEDMHMSANLHGVSDIDEGMDLLYQSAKELPDCRELYLCLYENWNEISGHIREITNTEEELLDSGSLLLKLALKDGKRLPECTFTNRHILPDFLNDTDTTAYIFTPLFFGRKTFGYIALSYYQNAAYTFPFISWLMNVNSMLKSLCDNRNMELLMSSLENLYASDELTGLYNRQGFLIHARPLAAQAAASGKTLAAMVWHLDGLRTINHTFGHTEGNFAIQVLAHALENSCPEDMVCCRFSDDEFHLLGMGYTPERAAELTGRIHKYLEHYNRLHTKGYLIRASSSFRIDKIDDPGRMQEILEQAERCMRAEESLKDQSIFR